MMNDFLIDILLDKPKFDDKQKGWICMVIRSGF